MLNMNPVFLVEEQYATEPTRSSSWRFVWSVRFLSDPRVLLKNWIWVWGRGRIFLICSKNMKRMEVWKMFNVTLQRLRKIFWQNSKVKICNFKSSKLRQLNMSVNGWTCLAIGDRFMTLVFTFPVNRSLCIDCNVNKKKSQTRSQRQWKNGHSMWAFKIFYLSKSCQFPIARKIISNLYRH